MSLIELNFTADQAVPGVSFPVLNSGGTITFTTSAIDNTTTKFVSLLLQIDYTLGDFSSPNYKLYMLRSQDGVTFDVKAPTNLLWTTSLTNASFSPEAGVNSIPTEPLGQLPPYFMFHFEASGTIGGDQVTSLIYTGDKEETV
jgi:hypothetical protein